MLAAAPRRNPSHSVNKKRKMKFIGACRLGPSQQIMANMITIDNIRTEMKNPGLFAVHPLTGSEYRNNAINPVVIANWTIRIP